MWQGKVVEGPYPIGGTPVCPQPSIYDELVDQLDWSPEELSPKLDHERLMAQYPTRLLDGNRIIDVLDLNEQVTIPRQATKKKPAKKAATKKKGNNSNA